MSRFLHSKNTSKNVFFPVLTFDLKRVQSRETVSAGPKTFPAPKLVVVGTVESCELVGLDGGCFEEASEGEIRAGRICAIGSMNFAIPAEKRNRGDGGKPSAHS
jgi:hypothetical protein